MEISIVVFSLFFVYLCVMTARFEREDMRRRAHHKRVTAFLEPMTIYLSSCEEYSEEGFSRFLETQGRNYNEWRKEGKDIRAATRTGE